ncbi:unnamed protein product [Albugo candida]|uniref:Uncharacterized protein n=1 Tax=Albugo candida TaxID=65357 RepID=A0A024FV47_9STRA|nr:unnamed protein product [Albugo candida]|eukprot:CCI10812.1 unnamed protein product [Albugo candida]
MVSYAFTVLVLCLITFGVTAHIEATYIPGTCLEKSNRIIAYQNNCIRRSQPLKRACDQKTFVKKRMISPIEFSVSAGTPRMTISRPISDQYIYFFVIKGCSIFLRPGYARSISNVIAQLEALCHRLRVSRKLTAFALIELTVGAIDSVNQLFVL